MLSPVNYKRRHKILKLLIAKKATQQGRPMCKEISLHVDELATVLKIPSQKVRELVASMIIDDDVQYCPESKGYLFNTSKGFASYTSKKYLQLGKKTVNDAIYDVTKWLLPLTLAFVTMYTVLEAKKESKENKTRLNNLQQELNSLRQSIETQRQNRINIDSTGAKPIDTAQQL